MARCTANTSAIVYSRLVACAVLQARAKASADMRLRTSAWSRPYSGASAVAVEDPRRAASPPQHPARGPLVRGLAAPHSPPGVPRQPPRPAPLALGIPSAGAMPVLAHEIGTPRLRMTRSVNSA
jgi:hypothetical protein